jgi:hypothetical protein
MAWEGTVSSQSNHSGHDIPLFKSEPDGASASENNNKKQISSSASRIISLCLVEPSNLVRAGLLCSQGPLSSWHLCVTTPTMSALAASAKGASFLILLQVASRGFTFLINQILLRYLSPELLGLSSQLELYSITVLYFARESIRVAVQRQPDRTQSVVNLAYISISFGIPLSYILAKLYLRAELPPVPFFAESLSVYAFASVIELFAEPAFVATQQKLLYRVRASAEAGATLVRCMVTCGAVFWAANAGRDIGVLPFALGQLAYASFLLKLYVFQMWFVDAKGDYSLLPRRLVSGYAYNARFLRRTKLIAEQTT